MQRAASPVSGFERSAVLRWTLIGDAAVVLVTGLLMFVAAGPLSDWLDLPEALLRLPGLFLIAYAAVVGWYSNQPVYSRGAIAALIVVNLAWAIGCLIVLAFGDIDPNGLGVGFILLNAAACLVVAALEVTHLPN